MSPALLFSGIAAFGLAVVLTPAVMRLAQAWGAVDDPHRAPERKRHQRPTPLLGGAVLVVAFGLVVWAIQLFGFGAGLRLPLKQLVGMTVAAVCLLIGGALDDRYNLSPRQQLIGPILAVLAVIASGIGIPHITNPFGGLIPLNTISWALFTWHGTTYHFVLWADIFTALWLFITMYATKLLDGLDGLVSGFGVIGAIAVYLLTLRPEVNQPEVGALSIVFGAACLGFLMYNWHPAKIFLGEGGSLFVGFILGVLAIVSGGKLATALLILGLPILDLVFVVFYRWFILHRSPFRTADRSHLHFRLLDQGWSVRQTVGFLHAVTTVFALSTLFVHGPAKVAVLGGLGAFMVLLVTFILRRSPPTQP